MSCEGILFLKNKMWQFAKALPMFWGSLLSWASKNASRINGNLFCLSDVIAELTARMQIQGLAPSQKRHLGASGRAGLLNSWQLLQQAVAADSRSARQLGAGRSRSSSRQREDSVGCISRCDCGGRQAQRTFQEREFARLCSGIESEGQARQ